MMTRNELATGAGAILLLALYCANIPREQGRPAAPEAPQPDAAPASQQPPADCREMALADLEPLVYRLEPEIKSVYVTDLWYSLPFDRKETLVLYFAKCHGAGRVRDARSGRTIARAGLPGVQLEE
jgi:hypothetical protein